MARMIDAGSLRDNITDIYGGSDRLIYLANVLSLIDAQPTLTPPPITGDTSDGYHTFNELYHHRAILFSVICNERPDIAWKSKRHHDGTMYDGMFIVGIDTPEGQATYHYDIEPYWSMFRVKELELAPEWDGHTPDEAIQRIGTLTPPNEPLTQADLDSMDYDKVWIDYEDGAGEWALVCNGYIYSIDTLEGAGFDFVDYMRGERLEPHGYKVYRRPPEAKDNNVPTNEPLTIEELLKMDGEPVYVVFMPDSSGERSQSWALVNVDEKYGEVYLVDSIPGASCYYDEIWADLEGIYRRPPEGEEDT